MHLVSSHIDVSSLLLRTVVKCLLDFSLILIDMVDVSFCGFAQPGSRTSILAGQ